MDSSLCSSCGNEVPFSLELCPHCGNQGPPPNVKAARTAEERQALEQRYQAAFQNAVVRGCREVLESFETALQSSKAVINRPLADVERLAVSDRQLYATYYQRLGSEVQAPEGDVWDRWRRMADATLFPLYEERIRFAALTLDDQGVWSYGECSVVLREELIVRRASVFEDNSTVFLRDRDFKLSPGHRATWEDRSRLAVAKLAPAVHADTLPADFPEFVMQQGPTSEDDRFIEVHIWGPVTARTCQRVILVPKGRKTGQVFRKALRARLAAVGVELEER